jgi:hypothetical protein
MTNGLLIYGEIFAHFPWVGGREGGLPWIGQHLSLATRLLQGDIIGFSANPRIQIAISQFFLLSNFIMD